MPSVDLFHPATIILAFAIAIAFYSSQQANRRRMMATKFGGDFLNGVYITVMGGLSGGLAAFIAATGSLIQAATPDYRLDQTRNLRIGGALLLSALAIVVSVRGVSDLLPIAAVVFCRFTELQKDPQRVRFGYFLSVFPWGYYNYANGLLWLVLYNILIGVSLMIAIIRHRKPVTPEDPV